MDVCVCVLRERWKMSRATCIPIRLARPQLNRPYNLSDAFDQPQ
jgi:hypothetical protein